MSTGTGRVTSICICVATGMDTVQEQAQQWAETWVEVEVENPGQSPGTSEPLSAPSGLRGRAVLTERNPQLHPLPPASGAYG